MTEKTQKMNQEINQQSIDDTQSNNEKEIFISGKKIITESDLVQKKQWPQFKPGSIIKVHYIIREGDKERIQIFEGTVIRIKGEDINKTFTVRKISHGVGVERTFPYHSPWIANIELVRHGKARRAKLYFLRNRVGKSTKLKEVFE